jgi:hypothetical protein
MMFHGSGAVVRMLGQQARAVPPSSRSIYERGPHGCVSRFLRESFAALCVRQAIFNS